MSKARFVAIPLTILVIMALLAVGGWAVHRIGWTQGYASGQLATAGEATPTVPYAPYDLGHLGLFLVVGLVLLLVVGMIGKLLRFWAWGTVAAPWMMAHGTWRMASKRNAERWARHWHRPHGPVPPWYWDWEEPSGEEAQTPESGAETGAAQARS